MATNKDKLIAAAQKLVEKGQFDKAIKEYLKVVATDDKDVRIWLKIGDLYAKLGKRPEAAETYQRVAEFYSEQGFYLKSVAVYKQILKIDPRLVDVNQRLAELYKQLGLLSDAMSQYETVAAFFHKEGRTREALGALKQIVELDPETVANRIKLAELYSKEQMAREAIDEFSKAAEQLKEAGRTDDYMKVAERLLFHSPDNRPVSKELARLYIEKGDPRRALPKLQVCFKADSRDTDVLSLLARAFEALDQRQKSVSVLKELARILGENGDRQARDEVYRKILMLQPGDPDAETALAGKPKEPAPVGPRSTAPPNAPTLSASWPPKNVANVANPPPVTNTTGSQPLVREPFPQPRAPNVPPPPIEDAPPVDEFDAKSEATVNAMSRTPQEARTSIGQKPADAVPDGEAIAKILNETDVYIKYKLYAKAIEHVQRVFEHDGAHVEAREKLKALYLTVGKRDEAVLELWALAEQAEHGRQRRYLREILELDPHNVKAANMLGTDVGMRPEDLDGAPPPAAETTLDVDEDQLEELSADEFDVADPSSKIALDLAGAEPADESMPQGERYREEPNVAPAEDGDDDLIPLVVEPVAEAPAADEAREPVEDRFGFGDDVESDAEIAAPLAATDSEQLAVAAGADAIEREQPTPTAKEPPARPRKAAFTDDENDLRTRFDDSPLKFLGDQALFGAQGGDDVDDSELPPAPRGTTATVPKAAVLADDDSAPTPDVGDVPPVDGGSLEDDLDEADFFIQQSLFEEAREILVALLERHPSHPLVTLKLRDLDAMQNAGAAPAPIAAEPTPTPPSPSEPVTDLSALPPDELPGDAAAQPPDAGDPVYEVTRRGVIEKGVTAEDFETHYDLGIAYKEMGLLDDAIAEFKLVMKDPAREVQCHLMIGLCLLEKGLQTEAIGHFKKGLYVEGITERESLSLYFELGQAYERLGDPREALYYYEKVLKRDPRFRNIEKIVENLRGGQTAAAAAAPTPGGDDLDAAFDTLLDGEQR